MTVNRARANRWTDGLFWAVAIAMVLALAGFGSLGVWSIAHWPWARWERESEASAEATDRASRKAHEPVEVVTRSVPSTPTREIGPHGEVIVNPAWAVRPAGQYPDLAQSKGIESGAVQLQCEGLASGELGACEILSETPTGAGFAEAAVAGTRSARLQPRSIDGFKTDTSVRFTVRFRLE